MDVVTGAFGYIGRYVAAQLLDSGRQVKTITTHVDKPNPFGEKVKAYPYNFDRPDLLTKTLRETKSTFSAETSSLRVGFISCSKVFAESEIFQHLE